MGEDKPGTILATSEGGVSGEHPQVEPSSFLVGPSTAAQFNTLRLQLIPIACWRVDDIRFAFDSSFIAPDPDVGSTNDIRTELAHLKDLVKAHPGCPLSVFGHADPTGTDDYNKALSGRRAMAVYALLIAQADPGKAVSLWTDISGTEHWDSKKRDTMRALTGLPPGGSDSSLFRAYLQALCPLDLKLDPHADFLAHGADAGGKGDYQGCGEFNPVLVFSQTKQARFDSAKQQGDAAGIADRDAQSAPDRRVVVLMFRKDSRVDPAKWPCPRVKEGVAGCKARFFSNGEQRRNTRLPDTDRKFEDKRDTFACRFYQRMMDRSPCERFLRSIRIRLHDFRGRVLPRATYVVIIDAQARPVKTADGQGEFILQDVEIPSKVTIRWSPEKEKEAPAPSQAPQMQDEPPSLLDLSGEHAEIIPGPKPREFDYENVVFIDVDDAAEEAAATAANTPAHRKLLNMGYPRGVPVTENLKAFQRHCGKQPTGRLQDIEAELNQRYDLCKPAPGLR